MLPRRLSTCVILAAALALSAAQGRAVEPQRSVVLDLAIAFAPGAAISQADASTPLFWGRYQAGRVAGRNFRIFPDASASFGSGTSLYGDRIDVVCDVPALRCSLTDSEATTHLVTAADRFRLDTSAPELSSFAIARAYACWVLAGQRFQPETPPVAAEGGVAVPAHKPSVEDASTLRSQPAGPQFGRHEPTAARGDRLSPVPREEGQSAQPARTLSTPARTTPSRQAGAIPPGPQTVHETRPSKSTGVKRDRLRRKDVEEQPRATASKRESPAETFFKRLKPDCILSAGVGISYQDEASDSTRQGKLQTALTCTVTPVPKLRITTSVLLYPISGQQQPDDSDYNYSIAYRFTDDLTLSYASYSGNRWTTQPGVKHSGGLTGGTFTLSHRFATDLPLFERNNAAIRDFGCAGSVSYAPRYGTDGQGQRRNKTSLGLSCGFIVLDRLQLRASAHFYPIPDQQQPWDPDFTYSASYQLTDKLTLEYANYSGNRWPWNETKGNARGLASGGLRLAYKLDF